MRHTGFTSRAFQDRTDSTQVKRRQCFVSWPPSADRGRSLLTSDCSAVSSTPSFGSEQPPWKGCAKPSLRIEGPRLSLQVLQSSELNDSAGERPTGRVRATAGARAASAMQKIAQVTQDMRPRTSGQSHGQRCCPGCSLHTCKRRHGYLFSCVAGLRPPATAAGAVSEPPDMWCFCGFRGCMTALCRKPAGYTGSSRSRAPAAAGQGAVCCKHCRQRSGVNHDAVLERGRCVGESPGGGADANDATIVQPADPAAPQD